MDTLLGAHLESRAGVTHTQTPNGAELFTEPELVGKIQLKNLAWESLKPGQYNHSSKGSL